MLMTPGQGYLLGRQLILQNGNQRILLGKQRIFLGDNRCQFLKAVL
jgi:hypothetical protein